MIEGILIATTREMITAETRLFYVSRARIAS